MRHLAVLIGIAALAVGCTQPSGQASPSPSVSVASGSPLASATRTAGASPSGSPTTGRTVELRAVTPENNARVGDNNGAGWTIDLLARGGGAGTATTTGVPAASPSGSPTATPAATTVTTTTGAVCTTPAFVAQGQPGANAAMPGLVVLLSTNSDPRQNLAGLFQIVALDDTGANRLCHAVWFAAQGRFGQNVDSEMTAFIVDGQAPATVPQDRSSLRIISNEVTVRFHINGTTSSGSPAPAGSPSGSPRTSPSGSPAGTPAGSPSPTKTP